MKVKVGDTIYDSADTRIMVILTDDDKNNIRNMHPSCTKYAAFPDTCLESGVCRWMEDDESKPPKLNIRCQCKSGGVTGTTALNVVAVEQEDDGSFTAVTDYWPGNVGDK